MHDLVRVGGTSAAARSDVREGGLAALEVAHVLVEAAFDRGVFGLEHTQVPLSAHKHHHFQGQNPPFAGAESTIFRGKIHHFQCEIHHFPVNSHAALAADLSHGPQPQTKTKENNSNDFAISNAKFIILNAKLEKHQTILRYQATPEHGCMVPGGL